MKVETKLLKAVLPIINKDQMDVFKNVYIDETQNTFTVFNGHYALFIRYGEDGEYPDIPNLEYKAIPFKNVKMAIAAGDKFTELSDLVDDSVVVPEGIVNGLSKLATINTEKATPVQDTFGLCLDHFSKFMRTLVVAKDCAPHIGRNKPVTAYTVRLTERNQLVFKSKSESVTVLAFAATIVLPDESKE